MYKMKTIPHTSAIFRTASGKIMCNGANGIVMETVFQLRVDYKVWRLMSASDYRRYKRVQQMVHKTLFDELSLFYSKQFAEYKTVMDYF